MVIVGTGYDTIGVAANCNDVCTITGIDGIAGTVDRDVVSIGSSGNLVGAAMHCDDVITITGINGIAGTIDCDVVTIGASSDLIGATANCDDVCTITSIDSIAGAIDCDVVITAASGDMIAAAERDFIVAGDKTSNGNVTSSAEVEFARRCGIDRAAGAFYLHNTAAGGIHCNCIVGCEVEFAA